jgi:hypothetical protein
MEDFLLRRIARIDWATVNVVGFSCVASQVLTSIYLSRILKARTAGRIAVVFGGPNFERYNTAAFARAFPEVDYFVAGDGEDPLAGILEHRPAGSVIAVGSATSVTPRHPGGRSAATARLPLPDYRNAGVDLAKGRYSLGTSLAKGCSHGRCSFCGIAGPGRTGRSPDDVFSEIQHLVQTYRTENINFGDWEINGDPDQLEALCDRLIQAKIRISAWGEMNARNTSPQLLHKMVEAGISYVQLGIESFSPRILKRIGKPATVVDNVKALRWGIEAGMENLHFNLLCDYPGTSHADVVDTQCTLRAIAHLLRGPVSVAFNEVELYRTSLMFRHAGRIGLTGLRDFVYCRRCYPEAHVGPLPMFGIDFRRPPLDPLWKQLVAFVARVRRRPVRLEVRRTREGLMEILDTRNRRRRTTVIDGLGARVLELLGGTVMTKDQLAESIGATQSEVTAIVRRFRDEAWVMQDRKQLLALPIRKYRWTPDRNRGLGG